MAPPRVLHVVESLGRGAVENWLVRMLRHARSSGAEVDWTFYCALGQAGELADEVRALGGGVVVSPVPIGRKAAFTAALRREAERGGYDVLHCHHDLVSSLYLVGTLGLPLRRLVHVHNADEAVLTDNPLKQWIYREPMRLACLTLADRIVGISSHTLDTFLAGRPRRPGRDVVHYYGVDPSPFQQGGLTRAGLRKDLGLRAENRLLLFAGRLVPEKNPLFALDVLAEMRKRDAAVHGVFVGAGSMEEALRARAEALGVAGAVRMLGWRRDVPALMGACDWFILPRPEAPMEGFGLAVVEAQLAGLRLLLSRGIPDDPLLPTARYRRLPLAAGAAAWAEQALALLAEPAPKARHAWAALELSPLAMDKALDSLMFLHNDGIRGGGRSHSRRGPRNRRSKRQARSSRTAMC